MKFGEQEGKEGCFREEAQGAGTWVSLMGYVGNAGEGYGSDLGFPEIGAGCGRLREFQGPAAFERRV